MDGYLYCSYIKGYRRSVSRNVSRPQSELVVNDIKICLCGDSGVGKTSIATRFVRGQFPVLSPETIGASFGSKTITVDGTTFRLNIWDTAGQERYRSLMPMYFREATAALVVYDITHQKTFESLPSWLQDLSEHCQDPPLITIVGNKCDIEDEREVSREEGEKFAERMELPFVEASAHTGVNIDKLFLDICRQLNPEPEGLPCRDSIQLALPTKEEVKKQKHCCGQGVHPRKQTQKGAMTQELSQ